MSNAEPQTAVRAKSQFREILEAVVVALLLAAVVRVFVVQVGDGILSIAAFAEGRTDEELFELMKQMGTIAAGRM